MDGNLRRGCLYPRHEDRGGAQLPEQPRGGDFALRRRRGGAFPRRHRDDLRRNAVGIRPLRSQARRFRAGEQRGQRPFRLRFRPGGARHDLGAGPQQGRFSVRCRFRRFPALYVRPEQHAQQRLHPARQPRRRVAGDGDGVVPAEPRNPALRSVQCRRRQAERSADRLAGRRRRRNALDCEQQRAFQPRHRDAGGALPPDRPRRPHRQPVQRPRFAAHARRTALFQRHQRLFSLPARGSATQRVRPFGLHDRAPHQRPRGGDRPRGPESFAAQISAASEQGAQTEIQPELRRVYLCGPELPVLVQEWLYLPARRAG